MADTYHSLAVGLLQLSHLGGHLHLEMDLIRVLADHSKLDVLGATIVLSAAFAGVHWWLLLLLMIGIESVGFQVETEGKRE